MQDKKKKQLTETPSFKSTRSAMIAIGFIIGFLLLGIIFLFVVNPERIAELGILSVSWIVFDFYMFYLTLALRKFGNNEIDKGSTIVKKANIYFMTAVLLLFIFLSLILSYQNSLLGISVYVLSLILIGVFFSFLKKHFKYA